MVTSRLYTCVWGREHTYVEEQLRIEFNKIGPTVLQSLARAVATSTCLLPLFPMLVALLFTLSPPFLLFGSASKYPIIPHMLAVPLNHAIICLFFPSETHDNPVSCFLCLQSSGWRCSGLCIVPSVALRSCTALPFDFVICYFLGFLCLVITSLVSCLSLLCWMTINQMILPKFKCPYLLHPLTVTVIMKQLFSLCWNNLEGKQCQAEPLLSVIIHNTILSMWL